LRRWRPNQSEEPIDTAEKTKEEKQYEVMLSANVTLEKKHRQLEKEFREMKEMHEASLTKQINELSKEKEMQNRNPVVTQGDLEGHIPMMSFPISGGMLFICGVGCLLEWLSKN
jgi:hypothetical protein